MDTAANYRRDAETAVRPLLEAAVDLAMAGIPVLPCHYPVRAGVTDEGWPQGLGKVRECLVHGLVMPRSGRTRVASRPLRRSAAAMLRAPCRRRMPMARFLRLAMARGAVPVRTWEASSA